MPGDDWKNQGKEVGKEGQTGIMIDFFCATEFGDKTR